MSMTTAVTRKAALWSGFLAGALAVAPGLVLAQNGAWSTAGGGSWPVTGNWTGGTVANGADSTATFSQDIAAGVTYTVTLDGARTLGNVSMTDSGAGTAGFWSLNDGSGGPLTLAVTSGTPSLSVATNNFSSVLATLAGTQGIVKNSAGTLFLGGNNTYTGITRVAAGTLELLTADAFGATGAGNETIVASGARARIGGNFITNEDFSIAGAGISGAINFGSSQTGVTVSATIGGQVTLTANARIDSATGSQGTFEGGSGITLDLAANSGTFAGGGTTRVNRPIVGTGAVISNGSGVLTLAAANTYTGSTAIMNNGRIELGAGGTAGSLSTSSAIYLHTASATFLVNQSDTVTQGVDFSGAAITSGAAGTGNLTQAGSGTTVLTAANAYTGATSVNAGALFINGNQTAAVGPVSVAAGALLGGSGTTGGAVSIAAGGIVAPGAGGVGTLTASSTFSLGSTSIMNFELNPANATVGGGINDLIAGVTNLTLDGSLNVTGAGDWTAVADFTTWRLFSYSGVLTDNVLSLGTMPTLGAGQSFAIDTATPGQVNLVAVPEPAAASLLAGLAVGVGLLARRHRRSRHRCPAGAEPHQRGVAGETNCSA